MSHINHHHNGTDSKVVCRAFGGLKHIHISSTYLYFIKVLIKVSDGLPSGGCLIGSGFNPVCGRTAAELDSALDTRRGISNLLRHLSAHHGAHTGGKQPSNNPCVISSSLLLRMFYGKQCVLAGVF